MSQKHHIVYKNDHQEDWTVEINGWQHKVVTQLQRMKATHTNYAAVTNFVHAVIHEWQRIRYQIDIMEDRNLNK